MKKYRIIKIESNVDTTKYIIQRSYKVLPFIHIWIEIKFPKIVYSTNTFRNHYYKTKLEFNSLNRAKMIVELLKGDLAKTYIYRGYPIYTKLVDDPNPYIKYCVRDITEYITLEYQLKPFNSLDEAKQWIDRQFPTIKKTIIEI